MTKWLQAEKAEKEKEILIPLYQICSKHRGKWGAKTSNRFMKMNIITVTRSIKTSHYLILNS